MLFSTVLPLQVLFVVHNYQKKSGNKTKASLDKEPVAPPSTKQYIMPLYYKSIPS